MFKQLLRSKSLRRRARWILAILALTLVVPFILFFHWSGSGAGSGPGGGAGVIFGRAVPWETFQQEYQAIRRTLEDQLGDVPQLFEPFLRQQAWDRLILREEARRRVRISDEELARHLHSQPAFQQDGVFLPELYFRFVRGLGTSPQVFEERLRDDLRIQRLIETIKAEVSVTEEELATAYAKTYERRRAVLFLVEPAAFEPQARAGLSDEALREAYRSHQEALRRPPQRTIEYLGVTRDEAEAQIARQPLSDEALGAFYDIHQDDFADATGTVAPFDELRETVRQRLIEERTRKHLAMVALDLQDDLDAGLRFAEIVLTRGLMAKRVGPIERTAPGVANGPSRAMLEAAFEAPLGHMTTALRDATGVFVLMPIGESAAEVPPFEAAREELARLVVGERAREAAKARATRLREELLRKRQAGFTVDESSRLLDLAPLRPDPVTRQDPLGSLGLAPALTEALFALQPGRFAEVTEVPQGFAIGFVEEILPADFSDEAAKAASRERLLESKREERYATRLKALRQRARLKDFFHEEKMP